MKRIILSIFILVFTALPVYTQSYIGYLNKKVSMREGPGNEYPVIMSLKKNTPVFLFSLEEKNGYYNIIDIETNTEGYIPSTYVKSIETLDVTSDKIFVPRGSIGSSYTEVNVYNNTSKNMTLRLNSTSYSFSPRERKSITLSPGNYSFVASAPGVIPSYGTKYFERSMGYDWEFFIVTKRY